MNKFLIAMALLAATMTTSAAEPKAVTPGINFAQIEYTFRDTVGDNSNSPNRQGVNLAFGRTVYPGLTLDIGSQFRTEQLNKEGGSNSTRLEAGATYKLPVTQSVSAYVRGAVGEKFTTLDNFSYYSVEPGVAVKLTKELDVTAGYRFREAFSNSYADQTNTIRLGAVYHLDNTSAVTLRVDRATGDSDFYGVNVGYKVNF